MQCTHCNQQHPNHFVYCPNTSGYIHSNGGNTLTYNTTEFCATCGTKNEVGYSYCMNCGQSHLVKSQKKNAFNRMFENTISNIKMPSKVTINKESLKTTSVENINFIKRNKLILVPILISLIIMILGSFWIKSSALTALGDEFGYYDEETMAFAALLKPDVLEEMLYDEFGVDIDLPNFTSFPIMLALIHNADIKFEMTIGAMGEQEGIKVDLNNLFTGLLLIPILALIIGGIVYGRMAIKNNWPFYKGIIYSVLGYTVVMAVITIFARASFNKTVEAFFIEGSLKISLSTSFIDSLLTSFILSTLFFGSFALVSYYGKSIISNTMGKSKVLLYAFSAFAATFVGLLLNYLYSLLFIMEDLMEDGPEIPHAIMSIYTGIATWLMSILGKFQVNSGFENMSYRALFNGDENEYMVDMMGTDVLFQNSILLFLIAVIVIAVVGYFTFHAHLLNLKDVAIFGIMFTIIQLFLINAFSIKIGIDYIYDQNAITIGFDIVSTLLFAFIIAFASFYGGGYLRKVLNK